MFETKGRGPAGTTYNLLFVCTGNTCRSPMAAAVARAELARRDWPHADVRSAGTSARSGATASPEAVDSARDHELDLSPHRSQPLTEELVAWADLILAMSPSHLGVIADLGGEGKASLLMDFAAGDAGGRAVADPFGGGLDIYRQTLGQLLDAVPAALDRLEPILSP